MGKLEFWILGFSIDKTALLKQHFSLKSPLFLLELARLRKQLRVGLIICISAARRAIDYIGSFKRALLELFVRNFRLNF